MKKRKRTKKMRQFTPLFVGKTNSYLLGYMFISIALKIVARQKNKNGKSF